jgi:capsular exopolysaccharide synthesis family protein
MTNTQPTIDLHQYWDVLWSRKLAIIIPTLAAIALAAAFIVLQKPQYTATARVLVNPLLTPDPAGNTAKSNAPDMNTEQATAASGSVAALARTSLKVPSTGDRLLNHLNVSAASSGNILAFQYTSSNAQQAAQYANAFAQAYITYRNDSALKPLAAAVAKIRQSMTALEDQLVHSGTARRPVLQSQLRSAASQLQAFESDEQLVFGGQVIATAVPPSSPSSPKIARTLVIAGVIGLVLGIILALIREGMDRRIKSPGQMETQLRAPVLGVIPKFKGGSPERSLVTVNDPRSPASDAYRTTAVALENLATRTGARVIMIASPKEGGGASTTTANLGVILAQAGHQVILVSADLRNPRLHLILGVPDGRGLATALVDASNTERYLKGTRTPNLFLLRSGPRPEDPGALLSSQAAAKVFGALLALKPDFILVDAPPVLPVPDAMILSRHIHAAVISWNAEGFQAADLGMTRERLVRAGANVLGGIYSFASRKRGRSVSEAGSGLGGPEVLSQGDMRRAGVSGSMAKDPLDRIDPAPVGNRSVPAPPRYGTSGRTPS